ncbi:MAG: 4-coumarate--CoA ligase, partial [Polaromonas sp.]|nr:4-coumarate--CoA ligase [Gemmatimonadaceae bacterium]
LKAFVVPREGRTGDASLHAELEAWVTSRLSTPERPKAFTFGDAIPLQAGKGTDWPSIT